jgi:catechol 2,3-dioxygenase-like lactoylglutathione lyase family enzyme
MGLSDGKVSAAIAVSDMERAAEFYEGKLGLKASGGDEADGGRTYECGGGSTLHIFPSPYAKASGATVAGFSVDDIQDTLDGLLSNGVSFERYDEGPLTTDEQGIARMGDFVGAWVKDPDGNVLSIGNM